MNRPPFAIWLCFPAAMLLAAGCNLLGPNHHYDAELAHYKQVAKTVEQPQLNTPLSDNAFTPRPRTLEHSGAPTQPQEWWDLTLDEAIQLAVSRSSVLRDLGGTIVRAPDAMRTILQPALVASDARFGMEAALSEFDAALSSSVIAEKNDRMVNNFVALGGTRFFQQDLITFQSQITKRAVAGTQMTLRGISIYDFNNASFNRFPSVWDSLVEAEVRQPLWQGAGARFNRIAGPNAVPGFYNGVLIARVNTDISTADFEMGVRDLVNNVENAYWDLYYAYRDLDARIQLRNAALEAWKRIKVLVESDQAGGLIEREVQAREQYFRYEEDVQNALAGTLLQSTTNFNGSNGGIFRGMGGVLVSERRLRLAIGLPITDGRMIRPADEPTLARVTFDWPNASDDAMSRRPELLRQRLVIKRREMEFVAARNFLLPKFDVLGRYRFRGLGRDLVGNQNLPFDPNDPTGAFANSSLANLVSGNFQEWQLGGEVTMPVGFRRGWAAVRNAQLNLARDKAILEEQERQIIFDLSNAVGDLERSYKIMETAYNRRLAAQQNVEILRFRVQSGQPVPPEQLLEGERRLLDADVQYHRSIVEHMLAIKNIHFEKGTLLEYGHIQLAEQLSVQQTRPQRRAPDEQSAQPGQMPGEPTPAVEPVPGTFPVPEAVPAVPQIPGLPQPPGEMTPPPPPPLPPSLPPGVRPATAVTENPPPTAPGTASGPEKALAQASEQAPEQALAPVISLGRAPVIVPVDGTSSAASTGIASPPDNSPLPAMAVPRDVESGAVRPVSYEFDFPPRAYTVVDPGTPPAASPPPQYAPAAAIPPPPAASPQSLPAPPPPAPQLIPVKPGSIQVTDIPLSAPQAAASRAIEQAWFSHGPGSAVTTVATVGQAPIPEITVTSATMPTGVQQAFWAATGDGGTQVWSPPTNVPPPAEAAVRLPLPDPDQRLPQPDGMLRLPAVDGR